MAEFSRFWTTNNTGDGPSGGYSSAVFTQFVRETFLTNPATEGVLFGVLNNLAVTGAASPVSVNTGAALVYGFYYGNDSAVNVTIPTPTTATRIDRIVLRVSWAAQTVRITRIAGTEGAGAPALTQVANTTWDIPLANASITTSGVITLTDQRTYLKHPGVYGWLQQANTWNGNQTVVGGVRGSSLSVDANFYSILSASNPIINFDGSDYLRYNRSTNIFELLIDGATVLLVDGAGLSTAGVNANLNASQLASGTVPLARLSGITGAQMASGTVNTTQLATDSVDDTIAGNRVPALIRRQGGSATDWSNPGTTTQTPAMVRMQAGVYTASASASPVTITFPVAFSQPPIFVATGNGDVNIVTLSSITSSQANIIVRDRSGSYNGGVVNWIAIGPE